VIYVIYLKSVSKFNAHNGHNLMQLAKHFTAILIWVIFPLVLWCTEIKEEEENVESTNNNYNQEIQWKYT
jgi:hypothetical protein